MMMIVMKASPEEAFFFQPKQSEDTFQWQNTEPRRQGSPKPFHGNRKDQRLLRIKIPTNQLHWTGVIVTLCMV